MLEYLGLSKAFVLCWTLPRKVEGYLLNGSRRAGVLSRIMDLGLRFMPAWRLAPRIVHVVGILLLAVSGLNATCSAEIDWVFLKRMLSYDSVMVRMFKS